MKKVSIIEQLEKHGPYAVVPECNGKTILWALARDFQGVKIKDYFPQACRKGVLIFLGSARSLDVARESLYSVKYRSPAPISKIHLVRPSLIHLEKHHHGLSVRESKGKVTKF